MNSPGPQIPRMAVRKICARCKAPEFSTTADASPSHEVAPRVVPRPPPRVGPTHLEVYGDVAKGILAGRTFRTPTIGSGDYPESFEQGVGYCKGTRIKNLMEFCLLLYFAGYSLAGG